MPRKLEIRHGVNYKLISLSMFSPHQVPQIQVTELCLNEGGTEIIAADLVQVQDDDTSTVDLKIVLSSTPVVGEVRKENVALHVGDIFTVDDLHRFMLVTKQTSFL